MTDNASVKRRRKRLSEILCYFPWPHCSGVYGILNVLDGRIYIGSCKNIYTRWRHHKFHLVKGIHHNYRLQEAFRESPEALIFQIIEEVSPENLTKREQFWIDFYKSATPDKGYNISPMAESSRGVQYRAETIEKYRLNLRSLNAALRRSVVQMDAFSRPIRIFDSLSAACAYLGKGKNTKSISTACEKSYFFAGWKWKFYDSSNPIEVFISEEIAEREPV